MAFSQYMPQGESLVYEARRHWMRYALPALTALGGFVVFGLYLKYSDQLPYRDRQEWGIYLMLGALVVGIVGSIWYFVLKFVDRFDVMFVSDNYVMHRNGFFSTKVNSLYKRHIELVNVSQTIWGKIFGYGDIVIIANGQSFATCKKIAQPMKFRNHVM